MADYVTDAEYLKSKELGGVISKGMAVMWKTQPKNPVDFLANWLLNYSQAEEMQESHIEAAALVELHAKQHAEARAQLNTQEAARAADKDQLDVVKQQFVRSIAEANDLGDHMQELTNHLQRFSGASAVYIGKLVSPKKTIKDSDDDNAHVDETSEKIIQFSHADEDHQFLVDEVLRKGNGLTFDVFEDKVDEEGKVVEKTELDHILVKEVVREPRIHFYTVPRLGSYLAVRLEYNSCLSVEAYNDGVRDALSCRDKIREQEEAKREHEDKEADRKDECAANDTEYVRDDGNWPEIKVKPYSTTKVQYVVCLNTLGQDREFTADQIRYSLDTIRLYRDEWQRIEKENLSKDINRKLDNMEAERTYREVNEPMDQAEAEKKAEEAVALKESQTEPMEEFQRSQELKKHRWDSLTRMFYDPEGAVQYQRQQEREKARQSMSGGGDRLGTPNTSGVGADAVEEKYVPLTPEHWKQPFNDLKDLNVLKMPRVLQVLFYLLKYDREMICERDTNKLDFKKAKQLIGEDLFERMSKYNPLGEREDNFKVYQKLSFQKRMIESMEEEKVDDYSTILGRIFRWVTQALELRTEDVKNRRDSIAVRKHERDMAMAEDKARTEKRQAALEEKSQEHDEKENENGKKFEDEQDSQSENGSPVQKMPYERQDLNLEEFNIEFDTMNPPIDIPNPIVECIDNDFDLSYSAPDVNAE